MARCPLSDVLLTDLSSAVKFKFAFSVAARRGVVEGAANGGNDWAARRLSPNWNVENAATFTLLAIIDGARGDIPIEMSVCIILLSNSITSFRYTGERDNGDEDQGQGRPLFFRA